MPHSLNSRPDEPAAGTIATVSSRARDGDHLLLAEIVRHIN
jgi:hypothetical protein